MHIFYSIPFSVIALSQCPLILCLRFPFCTSLFNKIPVHKTGRLLSLSHLPNPSRKAPYLKYNVPSQPDDWHPSLNALGFSF